MKKNVKRNSNREKVNMQELLARAMREALDDVRGGYTRVSISRGNRKMGNIKSVSHLPLVSCPRRCRGTCGSTSTKQGPCYAEKLCRIYPDTCKAWARNTALAILRPDVFWSAVEKAVSREKYFRFHVSGDMLSPDYLAHVVDVARRCPNCHILAFTKRYEWVNDYIRENGALPANLHIIMSGWQDMAPINPHILPETNVIYPGQDIPEKWHVCGGNCTNCARAGAGCWAAQPGETIAFHLH